MQRTRGKFGCLMRFLSFGARLCKRWPVLACPPFRSRMPGKQRRHPSEPRNRNSARYTKALLDFWTGHKLTAWRFLPILKEKGCKGGTAYEHTVYRRNGGSRPEAFWRLLPALLCCVAGDVVLALYNHLRQPGLFLAGLGTFLVGHALFVWGLCRLQPMGWPVPLAAVLGAGAAAALSGMPRMQTGRMRPWVVLYAAFVSALLGKGLQLAFGMAQPWCFLVLAGAALFWISDLLILFLYFYPSRHPAVHIANLLTYYYAMFLIAVSLAV